MKAILKLVKTSFKQLFRDKTAMFFTFAFPIIFMIIFGLIWSGDNNFKATVGVATSDDSPATTAITQAFNGVAVFTVETGSQDELVARFKKGELQAVISIPETTAGGQPIDIIVYYDPTNMNTSQVVLPVVQQVIDQVDRQVSHHTSLFELQARSVQSRQTRNIDYLVPGIIAMSLLSTGLFCAMPLIQQREKKILKRWSVTPIHRSSLIYSQVIFRLVLGVLQTAILIFIASTVFHVQMLGNWFTLFGIVVLGTLTLISIGYVIASFVKTEEGAMPVIQLVQFPMMFLSGIFFPVDNLPNFMKPVLQAMPVTYLGDSLRQIMIESTPLHSMNINVMVLGAWLIVCLAVSIKFFRWE